MAKKIDVDELKRWISEGRNFVLVDVLPEDCFGVQRLPGAGNACVYEVDFLDKIKTLGAAPDAPVVLYGAGKGALDSAVAAEKLERAGFQQVYDFRGGCTAWEEAGGSF